MAKDFLPLVLSVKAANWRANDDDSEAADAEFRHVRLRALERDGRGCRFCGFEAPKYQEVHHLNDDHADNRLENLVTACSFCHAVQHIGLAGKLRESTLAWIPEISQANLHHLVRAILVARRWASGVQADRRQRQEVLRAAADLAQAADAFDAKLKARAAEAEKRFVTSDPGELGTILHDLASEAGTAAMYERRSEFLAGLRLLPLGRRMNGGKDAMPDMIDSWLGAGGPYAGLGPRTWLSILNQVSS